MFDLYNIHHPLTKLDYEAKINNVMNNTHKNNLTLCDTGEMTKSRNKSRDKSPIKLNDKNLNLNNLEVNSNN